MPRLPDDYEDSLEGFLSFIAPWTWTQEEAASLINRKNLKAAWPESGTVYSFKQSKEGVLFNTFKTPATSTLITEKNYMDIFEKLTGPGVHLALKKGGNISFLKMNEVFDPVIRQLSSVLEDTNLPKVLNSIIVKYALGTAGIFKTAPSAVDPETPELTAEPAESVFDKKT
jgi:hypothetical protein